MVKHINDGENGVAKIMAYPVAAAERRRQKPANGEGGSWRKKPAKTAWRNGVAAISEMAKIMAKWLSA
jgi:hypothetical protein